MIEPEFVRIKTKCFLEDIVKQYSIQETIAQEGYVYCKIKRGIYGLKQVTWLAWNQLVKSLAINGYKPDTYAPNIWIYYTLKTNFFYV